MKLKAIAATFKRNKFLRIWNAPNGEQWIGNGAALYKMSGMPELTPAVILKIFDIPEDKQAEWNCELEEMPANMLELCKDEFYKPEQQFEQMKIGVDWLGKTLLFLKNPFDIIAVDEKFVKPLYDDIDYLQFIKRTYGSQNGFAIACYNALELQAVIMPFKIGGDMVDEMKNISGYFSSYRYKRLVESLSPKPCVDSETGEVLDGDSDELQETL